MKRFLKKVRDKLEYLLPNKIFTILFFFYTLFFVNYRFAFKKPIGFMKKLNSDLESFFNIRIKKFIHIDKFKFCNFGTGLLIESFCQEVYKPLLGSKKILNLGGYVGDSAIYLSQKGKKVYSFEPDPYKYNIMKKNIELNNLSYKIVPMNYAVTASNNDCGYMNKISNTDGSASITHYNDGYAKAREKIKCINIKDVLKMEKFDCLECDIEGAEWDIIKYFLKNKKEWTFKKAVIELHFSYMNFDTELHIMNNFLNWLEGKNFKCSFYYSPEEIKEHKKFSDFDILPTPERTRRPIMLYIEKIGDSEYLAI